MNQSPADSRSFPWHEAIENNVPGLPLQLIQLDLLSRVTMPL